MKINEAVEILETWVTDKRNKHKEHELIDATEVLLAEYAHVTLTCDEEAEKSDEDPDTIVWEMDNE